MTIQDWASFILTVLSILGILWVGARWVVKHYLKDIIHELKPNSGSSIKDQVTRLEKDITDLKDQNAAGDEYHQRLDTKIDHLTSVFIEYVSRQQK